MDYKAKYLKYKKKYNGLKQTGAGELKLPLINLSGPNSVTYYRHPKTNKKIIVIGDDHSGLEGICKDIPTIEIQDYMQQLLDNANTFDKPINLFIENGYANIPSKHELKHGINVGKSIMLTNNNSFMGKLIIFGFSNYKKTDNFKIHFSDIRNFLKGFTRIITTMDIKYLNIKFAPKQTILEDIQNYFIEIFNVFKLLKDQLNQYLNENNQKIFDEENYLYNTVAELFKQIRNFKGKNELLLKRLLNILYKVLVDYDNKFINDYKSPIDDYIKQFDKKMENGNMSKDKLFDALNEFNESISFYVNILLDKAMIVCIYINDLYMILRILNHDEFENNILTVGSRHLKTSIHDYLIACDFNLDLYYNNPPDYYEDHSIRCIKELLPFEKYFKGVNEEELKILNNFIEENKEKTINILEQKIDILLDYFEKHQYDSKQIEQVMKTKIEIYYLSNLLKDFKSDNLKINI